MNFLLTILGYSKAVCRILTTVIVSESSDAITLDPYWDPVSYACSILIEKKKKNQQ